MAANFKPCSVPDCNGNAHDDAQGRKGFCNKHYQRWRKHGDELHTSRTPDGVPKEFLDEIIQFEGDDCVIWPYSRAGRGYPVVRICGKKVRAHRVACEAINGPAPAERPHAAHSCGNGHLGCVNPRHLRWASHHENMADKIVHKTVTNKLTESDVRKILAMQGKMTQREIGTRFGISKTTVWKIHTRKHWAWLT